MFYTYLLYFLGFWVFLYVLWKKLKDDYLSSQVFTLGFYISLGLVVAVFVSQKFLPLWWFWLSFGGVSLGFLVASLRFKLRFYEVMEAVVIAILPWLSLIFLVDTLKNSSWFSFGMFIFLAILVGFYLFVRRRYRNFSWYRSGRVGLSGLMILGIFFLVRAVVAQMFPFMLSFAGKSESIIAAMFSFIIFLAIFNLSRQV